MTKFETMNIHRSSIEEALIDSYESVLRCAGTVQYAVYIWEDGEITLLQQAQGDHGYLIPRENETRALYYVETVGGSPIDLWDCANEAPPEDADERQRMEDEIIEWLVDEYRQGINDLMEQLLNEAAMTDEEEVI